MSDKCKGRQNNIILSDNGTIVNNQASVCRLFNGVVNAAADNISQDPNESVKHTNEDDLDEYVATVLHKYESHSSVKNVKDRGIPSHSFHFQC